MKKMILFLIAMSAGLPAVTAQEMAIIAHPSNETASLTASEVEDILLGRRQQWPSGNTVRLGIHRGGQVHDQVVQTFVNRTANQFRTYWRNQVFSGRGVMPQELEDDAAMIRFVAANANAFGYVDAGSINDSVKVITIVP